MEQKHGEGVQNTDADTEVDDSQSLPGHDSFDDFLMKESLLELSRTQCASAPPSTTAPLPPMTAPLASMITPQALPRSESAQTISPINLSIDTPITVAASSGLNVAAEWLIPGSLTPRGHSAGWPLYSPSNLITSAPRMPSPFPDSMPEEHIGQSINHLAGDSTSEDSAQGISSLPPTLCQTPDQQPSDFQQTSGPGPQDVNQMTNPTPDQASQNIYQLDLTPEELTQAMFSISQPVGQPTNQLTGDFSQISSSLLQDVDQPVNATSEYTGRNIDQFNDNQTTDNFAQIMDSQVQTSRPATNELARDFSRTPTPVSQDLNQSLSAILGNVGQIMNHLASMSRPSSPVPQDLSGETIDAVPQDMGYMRDPLTHQRSRTCSPLPHHCSRMASPTPPNFSQTMRPYLNDLSRTASPVPQGYRALCQTTRPMSADLSATQAPLTTGRGTTQSPLFQGANQGADCTSKANALFSSSSVTAQLTLDGPDVVQHPGVASDSEVDPDPIVTVTGRKRKLSHSNAGRLLQASNSDELPSYPVKRSKKFPDQQRGIDWLKKEAKTKFEDFYRTLLARWGVAPGHTGTCVLVPEAYRALEPLEIMETIVQDQEKYAAPGTPRSFFSMYDHATTMVRALAWFSQWPRTGVQLDNFIGCGKFAPMDASHTCHHDHCIIHITYEAADVNVSRTDCCREARALRQQNAADVPEHCSKHQPPCLMQVSDPADLERSQLTVTAYCTLDL